MSARLSISASVLLAGILSALPSAQAAPGDEVILALGVSRGGRHDAAQSRALQEHLQHSGETLASPRLSPADRLCGHQACFEELAQREGAAIVLGAQLQENPGGDIYSTVVLFDVARRVPIYEAGSCEHCSVEELSLKLGQQADSALRKYRDSRSTRRPVATALPDVPLVPGVAPSSASRATSPALTRPAATSPAAGPSRDGGHFAQLGLPRLVVGSALAVLGLGLLAPSFYWVSQHGKAPDPIDLCQPQPGFKCGPNDLSLPMGLGFASSAVLLTGAALVLFLPTPKSKSSSLAVALRGSLTPFVRAE